MKVKIKPGDFVRVTEDNIVYVDAMEIFNQNNVMTHKYKGKIAVTALNLHLYISDRGILLKKHKKGSMFTVEDVVERVDNAGNKQTKVLIEGVLYYHGFFEKAQKVKRRKLL